MFCVTDLEQAGINWAWDYLLQVIIDLRKKINANLEALPRNEPEEIAVENNFHEELAGPKEISGM